MSIKENQSKFEIEKEVQLGVEKSKIDFVIIYSNIYRLLLFLLIYLFKNNNFRKKIECRTFND
jgi:hypothetical protein